MDLLDVGFVIAGIILGLFSWLSSRRGAEIRKRLPETSGDNRIATVSDVREVTNAAVEALVEKASSELNQQFGVERNRLSQQIEEMRQEIKALKGANEGLKAQNQNLNSQVNDLTVQVAQLRDDLDEERQKREAAAALAETRLDMQREAEKRAAEIQEEAAAMRAQIRGMTEVLNALGSIQIVFSQNGSGEIKTGIVEQDKASQEIKEKETE